MLNVLFGFKGRINRTQYFLYSFAMGAVIAIALISATTSFAMSRHAGGALPSMAPILFVSLLCLPVLVWIGFALQAKRFRDIGWNPLYVIPAWIVIQLVDSALAAMFPFLAVSFAGRHGLLGVIANFGLTGCLLFWPGTPAGGSGPSGTYARDADPFSATPTPTYRSSPVQASPVQGGGFGRRGLAR